ADEKRCEEAREIFRTLMATRSMVMKHIRTIITSICCLCAFVAVIFRPGLFSIVARQKQKRGPGGQSREQRVALVIGNASYTVGPTLGNPVNDARDMADALRRVGFEVISGENLSQQGMEDRIRQFGEKLRQGGVGLFYYAGHGIQV